MWTSDWCVSHFILCCLFLLAFRSFITISFSIRVLFHGHWQLTGQQGKGGDHLLFHSTTSTHSQTFRHLFATLHVRWLSHIFNRNACIYQTATLDRFTTLSNYYLIHWWCNVDFRLLACWLAFRFCYSYFTWEICGLKLASTIILVLLTNYYVKCGM